MLSETYQYGNELPNQLNLNKKITDYVNQAREHFDNWILTKNPSKTPCTISDMTYESLKAFIPQELYQQANNPSLLKVSYCSMDSVNNNNLGLLIFKEQKPPPFREEHYSPFSQYCSLAMKRGSLVASDYPMLMVGLDISPATKAITISDYVDRKELRGKGIAKQFYLILEDLAKKMGFHFICGSNQKRNMGFFLNKLGRVQATHINEGLLSKILPNSDPEEYDCITVKFLYPEDKDIFLKEPQRVQTPFV